MGVQFKSVAPPFSCLDNFRFKIGFFRATLSMPMLVLDGFFDLTALEMCDSCWHYGVSSYVWFMRQLVQRPDDVKELRASVVLLNMLE